LNIALFIDRTETKILRKNPLFNETFRKENNCISKFIVKCNQTTYTVWSC